MGNTSSVEIDLPVGDWPEWHFFNSVETLLKDIITLTRNADSNRVGSLYPLLDSVEESTSTLRLLASKQALRDSYVISRVIYETAINACFLLTNPIELSNRAGVHARQKALRSLVRKIEIAGSTLFEFKFSDAENLMKKPEHKKWLDEFTTKSGREITSWTPENVQQRLEAIHLSFGGESTRGLAFGLLLYRHASEIAHGTLYGTLFSWGAMEANRPLNSPSDLALFRRAELRHLLKLVSFSLESLIRICATVLDNPNLGESAKKSRLDYYKNRERTSEPAK